ncbi:hypothetical protein KM792_10195 [Clostridium tyrobutyricum]|uniref:hypothetical protein n=1 Tax=Clostridium tyrobutyricum TaxID=1519 RepID=UPI001C393D24|nr:hypothetical protein [Clostridium tyrobutyricum]MBV4428717.1 hypothetical protein [Clostridium tyrobutyricum]MBV4443858.1 hypothetical protein [Clostridium tyrobutyricum]MBV4450022.1 hypothetical protein [Clostridium tyrobutyricum]
MNPGGFKEPENKDYKGIFGTYHIMIIYTKNCTGHGEYRGMCLIKTKEDRDCEIIKTDDDYNGVIIKVENEIDKLEKLYI